MNFRIALLALPYLLFASAPLSAQSPGAALDDAWIAVCAGSQPGSAFFARCQEILAAGPGSGDRRSAAATGNNLGTYAAQSGNAGERNIQAEGDEVAWRDTDGRLGWFFSYSYGDSDRDESEFENGFNADLRRITLGVDWRLSEQTLIGLALTRFDIDRRFERNAGRADTRQHSLIGFFDWHGGERLGVNGYLGYADLDHDLVRNIGYELVLFAGEPDEQTVILESQARASPGGSQLLAGGAVSWEFGDGAFGRALRAGLDGSQTRVDRFTETGGDGLAFQVNRLKRDSLTGRVGLDLNYSISTERGVVMPYARFDWVYEFKRDDRDLIVRFAGDSAETPITFAQESQDRSYAELAGGISAVFPGGVSLFAEIEGLFGHSQLDQYLVTAGLRFQM